MAWSINPAYKKIEQNPINPYHNTKATQANLKTWLKDGTPDWIRFPKDYRQYAIEAMQANKEQSDDQVAGYRMEDQKELTDFKSRNVNILGTKQFVLKLRENGIRCLAIYNGMPGTVGLWAIVPTTHGSDVRYITMMQIPAQIEWSVLRLDAHGLPAGEDYRGWRTVIAELIKKGAVTEQRAHEIFGKPTDSIVSRRYRRSLFQFRNRNVNVEVRDGF